jgi:hypothetical protein
MSFIFTTCIPMSNSRFADVMAAKAASRLPLQVNSDLSLPKGQLFNCYMGVVMPPLGPER